MILPPPVTSDCTLNDVEEYLDRMAAERRRRAALKRVRPGGTQAAADRGGEGDREHAEQ